jgi:peptidoglycan/LPS O-acetylase OafA/YrhL
MDAQTGLLKPSGGGPETGPRGSQRQIHAHTGLRGIAALLVVAYHQQLAPIYKLPVEVVTPVFRRSYLMVDLFFVLSGFIISYVYAADRKAKMPWSELKSFLVTRFARIYPLHVVGLLYLTLFTVASTLLLALTGREYTALGPRAFGDWLAQLLLLNSWVPNHFEWNVPSWSISAEAFAYFLFPLIVAAHVRGRRTAEFVFLAASLAFYAFVIATSGNLDITVGLAPARCIAGFVLGVLIYFHRGIALQLSDRALSLLQLVAIGWALAALATWTADPLIIPAFALIVFSTWPDRGVIASLLSKALPRWLGEISYSVYLLHVPIGATLWFLWSHVEPRLGLGSALSRTIWLSMTFFAVLSVSTLSYKYVELPARRALLRWAGRRRPPAGDVVIAAP